MFLLYFTENGHFPNNLWLPKEAFPRPGKTAGAFSSQVRGKH